MSALRAERIHATAQDDLPTAGAEQKSCVAILHPVGLWRFAEFGLSLWEFGPFVAFCITHFYIFPIWPAVFDSRPVGTTPADGSVRLSGCIVSCTWRLFQRVRSSRALPSSLA